MSHFAAILKRMLDEAACFDTRAEWARFFGVSIDAITQWVQDESLPRADLVRMLLDTLRLDSGDHSAVLGEFDALALLPAQEVSPFWARIGPTLREYLDNSTLATLGHQLRDMPHDAQHQVLVEGSWPR